MSRRQQGRTLPAEKRGERGEKGGREGRAFPAVTSAARMVSLFLVQRTSDAERRIGASEAVAGFAAGVVLRELARQPPTRAIREADRGETG